MWMHFSLIQHSFFEYLKKLTPASLTVHNVSKLEINKWLKMLRMTQTKTNIK